MVIRPKSSATVVVSLASTPARSSTCALGALSGSSVRSGLISVTAPTAVVLPAPKPPATRILMATGTSVAGGGPTGASEAAQAIDNLLQDARIRQPGRRYGVVHPDQ